MKRNTYFMDEEVKTDKVDIKYLKRLLSEIKPYKTLFLIALVLLAASSVVRCCRPCSCARS